MYEAYELVDWRCVRWSDECSIELGKGDQQGWVFITRAEQRLEPEFVQPRRCGKQKTQMFWGAFCYGKRSPLVIMERDPTARKNEYTAKSYRKILDEHLAPIMDDDAIYMHDGASIHTAHIIRDWLRDHMITIMNWPAYSPDLNPIENLWSILKNQIYIYYPELREAPNTEQTKEELIDAAQHVWELIGDQILVKLANSMPDRVTSVIRANGWYTKY